MLYARPVKLAWLTILGPITVGLWREGPALAVGFVLLFYAALVGGKIAIVWVVARGRQHLEGRWYQIILALCGIFLVGLGGLLLTQGVRALSGADVFGGAQ